MIQFTRTWLRRVLGQLLHVDDSPERTAAAFALGVFFGFSPFLGLHTILGIAFAFLLNLNRVAVLLGVYSNIPLTLAPYYATATWMGAQMTGEGLPGGPERFKTALRTLFDLSMFDGAFWHRLMLLLQPLAIPYMLGSTIGALLLSAAAYFVALAFVSSRRRLTDIIHHHQHPPKA
ncbi:MAG TPA: DUF2062 domain-containing protein [Vicinamibacterales bacterium]|nr:DUF2062 domain-containing protein [Vicinamibacterales bacterium]